MALCAILLRRERKRRAKRSKNRDANVPPVVRTIFDAEPDPWELDATHEELAATVVFAEQPHGPYDYGVPPSLAAKLKPGQRVQVPLGRGNRPIVGYCTAVASKTVGSRPLKPLGRLID